MVSHRPSQLGSLKKASYPRKQQPPPNSLLGRLLDAQAQGVGLDVDYSDGTVTAPLLRYEGPKRFRPAEFETYPVFSDALIRTAMKEAGDSVREVLNGKLLRGQFCVDFPGQSAGFYSPESEMRQFSQRSDVQITSITAIDFLRELQAYGFDIFSLTSAGRNVRFGKEIPFNQWRL